MKSKIISFNLIQNHIFQWNPKSYLSIKFKIISFNIISIYFYKTPLHFAVEKGNLEIIKLLLKNKTIDTRVEDDQGRKPIDYAPNNEIQKLLDH